VWEAQAITSWKMHRAPKIAVCSKIGPLAGAVLPTDTPACHSHPQSLLFCKAGCPDTSRTPGGGGTFFLTPPPPLPSGFVVSIAYQRQRTVGHWYWEL
jgi:hypothetical protein